MKKSTSSLAMMSPSCCRTSRNFDFPMKTIKFTKTYGHVEGVEIQRIFYPCSDFGREVSPCVSQVNMVMKALSRMCLFACMSILLMSMPFSLA